MTDLDLVNLDRIPKRHQQNNKKYFVKIKFNVNAIT